MHFDPMPETTLQTSDALLPPLRSLHRPKDMPMERYYGHLKNFWTRVGLSAAAFTMSATLLVAVVSAFYIVSSEPVLADSPDARSAVVACDARGDRVARQRCDRRLLANARAQDAGASQVATLAARRLKQQPDDSIRSRAVAVLRVNTSSGRASRFAGTVSPSARMACVFTTNSALVICWTGRSAGSSPLRMRAV
jgi:hypothetical protein